MNVIFVFIKKIPISFTKKKKELISQSFINLIPH
ncbi:hypothetical protein SP_0444 [Streptococcus pneumoniae TIGR4]|uniref:Uncharacterized protein n=1 Tax=Streptococcus pneumoniae serotype 4 (strain ATCC BAA-334 / TIGR4) TaxID=170187 RepID=A0A0H2UNL4_STRPN|nr:hypothetical protein SP_0444 [Streptococcus pneumoniae TIGR4]